MLCETCICEYIFLGNLNNAFSFLCKENGFRLGRVCIDFVRRQRAHGGSWNHSSYHGICYRSELLPGPESTIAPTVAIPTMSLSVLMTMPTSTTPRLSWLQRDAPHAGHCFGQNRSVPNQVLIASAFCPNLPYAKRRPNDMRARGACVQSMQPAQLQWTVSAALPTPPAKS